MLWRFVTLIIFLSSLATQVQAHGLTMSKGKTQLYDRQDNIMVKIELVPNDLQFNQKNNVQISVIDISESGVFNNNIKLKINQLDVQNKTNSIFSAEYPSGLFRQPVTFLAGGTHELQLLLDSGQPDNEKIFKFKFELKDNRGFARTTAMVAFAAFIIFTCIIGLVIKTRPQLRGDRYS
jgi:hypothetical protein